MTILFAPATYSAVHNDLFFTVSDAKASDPVTYPNYKYVADIYINGVFITRLRKFPDPTYNFGVFNVAAIIRNYINVAFVPDAGGSMVSMQLGQGPFSADIQLKFGEEYGFTTTYNIVSDSIRKVFNYYLRLPDLASTPLAAFADKIVTNGNKSSNPLSTFKSTLSTDFLLVNYLATTTSPVTVTVTGTSSYSFTVTPITDHALIVLNISPIVINIHSAGQITSALDYYTVTIGSDTVRVNLFCEAIYKIYPVHFLTQYGGFETMLFSKVSRDNAKVDKKTFGALPYGISNTGVVSAINANAVFYESEYDYANTFSHTLTLNSNILTDIEYIWLEDLILSPLVYVQATGGFYPVKITNTDYEIRKQVNETDLNNLTITVDFGRTLNTQFR